MSLKKKLTQKTVEILISRKIDNVMNNSDAMYEGCGEMVSVLLGAQKSIIKEGGAVLKKNKKGIAKVALKVYENRELLQELFEDAKRLYGDISEGMGEIEIAKIEEAKINKAVEKYSAASHDMLLACTRL